jgi:hypothetical protein
MSKNGDWINLLLAFFCFLPQTSQAVSKGAFNTSTDAVLHDTVHDSNYQQIFSLSAGTIKPTSASVSKGSYIFTYDSKSTNTLFLEAGGATRIFHFGGAFYLNANLAYMRFSGAFSPDGIIPIPLNELRHRLIDLSVNLFGLDTRITHAWEWFPINWMIPFYEIGYIYTLYSQFGSSDFDSVQGGTGNVVAAAGLRFWLNPSASVQSENTQSTFSIPIFLNLKWNRVFSNGQPLDLGNSGLILGMSFGI